MLEKLILDELSPTRDSENEGDIELAEMICGNIVSMIHELCLAAKSASSSNSEDNITVEDHYMHNDGSVTDNFTHDVKLVKILVRLLNNCLREARNLMKFAHH